jgi:hypothetical protein
MPTAVDVICNTRLTDRIACAFRWGLVMLALGAGALHAEDVSKEYQVKAAFLYNFTKFVEWPAHGFADDAAPIVIAVLGENPFGDELEKLVHDRKVNGRTLHILRTQSAAAARSAHVVFIGHEDERQFEHELTALHAAGVLTVGESERFAAAGGIVRFTMLDDKVRFEINVAAAERGGLKISAQLQKLAVAIHHQP